MLEIVKNTIKHSVKCYGVTINCPQNQRYNVFVKKKNSKMELKIEDEQKFSPTFINIPWEDILYRHLFPYLQWQDIFSLRRVSKSCLQMVTEFLNQCRVVNLADISQRVNSAAFRIITIHNCVLTTLILRNCKWLTDELLLPVFENNSGLISVELSGCTGITTNVIEILALHNPNLQKLYLRDCYWLSPNSLKFIALHCTLLERLDLSSCWEINDDAVTFLVENCPNLRYLSLARIYSMTDCMLRAIAEHCYHLEHLNLAACWRITDQGMRFIAEYCQNLKLLQVKDCRDITEASLSKLRSRVKIDRACYPPPYYLGSYLQELRLHIQI